jgi:hypothetical protein
MLVAAVVAAFLHWRNASKHRRPENGNHRVARFTPIWALILVYTAFSLTSHLNIGHRHLLPVYPALFIACGACAYFFRTKSRLAIFSGILVCWQIAESSSVRPDYLTYFNQIAGGSKNGYRHLVDSSLDWGQDLPALKRWLNAHYGPAAGALYLAYFGTASPRWYGIEASSLPLDSSGVELTTFKPGTYCVSATILQQVYSFQPGRWRSEYESEYRLMLMRWVHRSSSSDCRPRRQQLEYVRFARLCAYLRQHKPVANVGNSILVFELNQQDLDRALYGPVVELVSAHMR